MNRKIEMVSRIHSIFVIPMFSMVEYGSEAAREVSCSVSPVSQFRSIAKNCERN